MSDTEQRLIEQVLAHPGDDAPRLLHADWLEEHGDSRGELIRVQCKLAGMDPVEPEYGELLLREESLLEQHQAAWLRNQPKFQDFALGVPRQQRFCNKSGQWREVYHRGYPGYGTFSHPSAANAVYQSVVKHAPVQRVSFRTSLKGWLDRADELTALHGVKGLMLVESSQLSLGDSSWLKDPPWTSLEELSITPRQPASLQQMAGSASYKNLKRLECNWLNPHPEGVHGLIESGVVAGLQQLDWQGPSFAGHIPALFTDSMALRKLTAGSMLTDADNADFFNAPGLHHLTELNIGHESPGEFLAGLLESGNFPHLRLLGVGNLNTRQSIDTREFPPGAASLRQLDLSNARINARTLKAICQSPSLANLTHLDVRNLALSDKQTKMLQNSANFAHLRKLAINTQKLSPSALKAMKKQFGKATTNSLGVAFFRK